MFKVSQNTVYQVVSKPSDSRSTVGAQPAGSWGLTLLWHLASAVGTEVYTSGSPPLSGLLDLGVSLCF